MEVFDTGPSGKAGLWRKKPLENEWLARWKSARLLRPGCPERQRRKSHAFRGGGRFEPEIARNAESNNEQSGERKGKQSQSKQIAGGGAWDLDSVYA